MNSFLDLKHLYVPIYDCFRSYIWDFNTVEDLAEFEISIFNRFPKLEDVKRTYSKLYRDIEDILSEDSEFDLAMTNFSKLIESIDSFYSNIYKVEEIGGDSIEDN